MVRALLAAVVCVACQGQPGAGGGSASRARVGVGSDASESTAPALTDDAAITGSEPDLRTARIKADEPEVPDPSRAIAELGAIPAWQAVVDRSQLLGRRGQHGVVYGLVGPAFLVAAPPPAAPAPGGAGVTAGPTTAAGVVLPPLMRALAPVDAAAAAPDATPMMPMMIDAAAPDATVTVIDAAAPVVLDAAAPVATPAPASVPANAGLVKSPYVWLIDDTEGNGALGIRIALGDKAKEGDRIAAGGAWQLDAERRWYWKADTVQPLAPAPTSDIKEPPPPEPSHAIAGGSLPAGVHTISVARDGDAVYFQIVGPAPATDGDGWQIADQLGSPVAAVMNLPGERASYGGQDMRASDERWQLKRGQTYWVRIGKLRKRGPDKPTTVNARTAPVRVL